MKKIINKNIHVACRCGKFFLYAILFLLNKNQQQKKTTLQILKNIATKIITFVGKFSGKN